jgi:hypothetical protein
MGCHGRDKLLPIVQLDGKRSCVLLPLVRLAVACIHNGHMPQAWVFQALESDNRIYYGYAALYALPLFRNGFDQDWFSITLLLACVVHVQVRSPTTHMTSGSA